MNNIADSKNLSTPLETCPYRLDGLKEFFNRDFDFFPSQWKKIVQDKIKEHLGLAQNRGI